MPQLGDDERSAREIMSRLRYLYALLTDGHIDNQLSIHALVSLEIFVQQWEENGHANVAEKALS